MHIMYVDCAVHCSVLSSNFFYCSTICKYEIIYWLCIQLASIIDSIFSEYEEYTIYMLVYIPVIIVHVYVGMYVQYVCMYACVYAYRYTLHAYIIAYKCICCSFFNWYILALLHQQCCQPLLPIWLLSVSWNDCISLL